MKKRNKYIIVAAVMVAVLTVTAVLFLRGRGELDMLRITVAWNPGSISCDIATAIAQGIDGDVEISHMPGALGALAYNAVFESAQSSVLATSLLAFVTAEDMGFGTSSRHDWVGWLVAFSPAAVVVPENSPLQSINDLPSAQRAANSGFGTTSFIAAHIFEEDNNLNLEHITLSSANEALNAISNGQADFAILLSAEIPPNTRVLTTLDFGEYYGIFAPSHLRQSHLNQIESTIQSAIQNPAFTNLTTTRNLTPLPANPTASHETIITLHPQIHQILTTTNFLPAN